MDRRFAQNLLARAGLDDQISIEPVEANSEEKYPVSRTIYQMVSTLGRIQESAVLQQLTELIERSATSTF